MIFIDKINTILFDLDGTLLNTLDDLADSVNHVLNTFGFPAVTVEDVRKFVGNGVTRLMELSIPGGITNKEFSECVDMFRKHYADNAQNKTVPYEGINELIKQLSEEGYHMAVVSNKFDKAVKELVRTYFGKYIRTAIGESKNVLKKPARDMVFKAIEEIGTTIDQAIYVGDSEVDVETAKNAGLLCVGVTWGFRDRDVLERKGSDYIIDRPCELLKILKDLGIHNISK